MFVNCSSISLKVTLLLLRDQVSPMEVAPAAELVAPAGKATRPRAASAAEWAVGNGHPSLGGSAVHVGVCAVRGNLWAFRSKGLCCRSDLVHSPCLVRINWRLLRKDGL